MKRLVSTALAIALLLGLGALAVLARGGGSILTPADSVVAAAAQPQTAAAPDAPAVGTPKYNIISLPLDGNQQFTSFDAKGLAAYIGKTAVDQVLLWNPGIQNWDTYNPNGGFGGNGSGTNFPLALNGVYVLLVNNGLTQTTLSFVGDVPDAGSVHYSLVGGSPTCKWNTITLPLDQASIVNAQALGIAIGKPIVSQILSWNPGIQNWDQWLPNGGFGGNGSGTNFLTQIGYPYLVCLTQNKNPWP